MDGRTLEVGSAKLRVLLAMLALSPGRAVPAAALAEQVWGPAPRCDVTGGLRALVSRARRTLGCGAGLIAAYGGGYLLDTARTGSDIEEFDRLAAAGRAGAEQGDHAGAVQSLAAALSLWRGEAFEGLTHHQFTAVPAGRLTRGLHEVTEALADGLLLLGRLEEATTLLERHVADNPIARLAMCVRS